MQRIHVSLVVLIVAGWLLSGHAVVAADFVSGTEDIPLMTQLTEQGSGALVFDTAAGRIVEVTASGTATAGAVRAFYAETLPQLGWAAKGTARWRRDGEELRLEFPAPNTVRFVLAPAAP